MIKLKYLLFVLLIFLLCPAAALATPRYLNTRLILVTFFAEDSGSGINQMQLSFDNKEWTDPEPYVTSKQMTFPKGDGTKCVYVKYQDNADNWSTPISACVQLDTEPPTGTIVIEAVVNFTVNLGVK